MELQEAMAQISEIRLQMARTTIFCGYRSVTVAFSGLLAITVALFQSMVLEDPLASIGAYLCLWIGTAVVSTGVAGGEIAFRYWKAHRPLERELTLLAIEQFLPSVVAGSLLTTLICLAAPGQIWMLPGLWAIVYALGVFASHRLLPGAVFWVAAYYLGSGGACLVFAQGSQALAPWTMAATFGVGQLLAACVLYWSLERETPSRSAFLPPGGAGED